MRLEGVTCVVTGGSRGIGRALADDLAAHGANLALCARSAGVMQDTAATIAKARGVEVVAEALDVCDATAIADFARHVESRLGTIRLLVNNAGVLGPVGTIDTVDLGAWRDTLLVNVAGLANTCAAFVPLMDGGSIVNLSGGGIGGPTPLARVSAYIASKGAVVAFTEALAAELAPRGIRVNAVAPGPVGTQFMAEVLDRGVDVAGRQLYESAMQQHEEVDVPTAFLELVRFLASDGSAWLSGKLLSARWDRVDELPARRSALEATSLLTLRRIDDDLFREGT